MTGPGTYTGQRTSKRPFLQTVNDFGNLLVWTGIGTTNHPNIGFVQSGYSGFPANFIGNAKSNDSPSLLLNPTMTQGVVAWTDTSGVVNYNTVSPGSKPSNNWEFDDPKRPDTNPNTAVGTIANSAATGGPAMTLSLLGGQPVVSVIWQDKTKNSMVAWQASIFGGQASTELFPLGHSCIDSPTLKGGSGGLTYLAYFDATTKSFTLVTSRRNSLEFDFAKAFSTSAITSEHAPAFVPLNNELAYVIWTDSSGIIRYQQIAIDGHGNWQVNTAAGTSGVISDAISYAGASANLVHNVIDGVTTAQIAIAYQDSGTSNINVYTFTPSFTPIYDSAAQAEEPAAS